MILRSITVRRR